MSKRPGLDMLRSMVRTAHGGAFTPSIKDAPGLFVLLLDADNATARGAERALARIGTSIVPVAAEHAMVGPPATRACVARMLGRLAAEPSARQWLLHALRDTDGRVRRAAANALGRAAPEGVEAGTRAAVEDALLRALERETEVEQQRAIVAALGKVGSSRSLTSLDALRAENDPELVRRVGRAAVRVARDEARSASGGIEGARLLPNPIDVILRCRRGVEAILRDEISAKGGQALVVGPAGGSGSVSARLVGPLDTLFSIRTMTTSGIVLARSASQRGPDLEAALVDAFTSDSARAIVERLTIGPVRYRIAWGGGGHRRAATWRCAQAIMARCPEWINDPTATTWEVIAHEDAPEAVIELRPRALLDPRFTYRVRDVPAASHPTLAAALVRTAGVREDDVVWDPFMGSGTELIERALAGPYARLYGSDLDARALEAARANFAQACLSGIELAQADASTFAPSGVNVVITNPPMGRRVSLTGGLASTLDHFLAHVGSMLSAGGRLVWLSPLPGRTASRAEEAGFELQCATEVDMGGFSAQLQKFAKRTIRPTVSYPGAGGVRKMTRRGSMRDRRGFTLVELMVVVIIVGVLAVLAIIGVRKYAANSKTAEARNSLGTIAKDASLAYQGNSMVHATIKVGMASVTRHQICGSASTPVPSAGVTAVKGRKYQSKASEWTVDEATNLGFACLKYHMIEPQYYMYTYVLTGAGYTVGDSFMATANGDLNGDGVLSTLSLSGKITFGTDLDIAPTIQEVDPVE